MKKKRPPHRASPHDRVTSAPAEKTARGRPVHIRGIWDLLNNIFIFDVRALAKRHNWSQTRPNCWADALMCRAGRRRGPVYVSCQKPLDETH